jgi:translocation and assembly module TamA
MMGLRLVGLGLVALIALAVPRLARADVPYSVDIALAGLQNKTLAAALDDASQLEALKNHPPPSAASLRRRADDDLPRLQEVMRAAGYWDAKVAFRLDTRTNPAHIVLTVTPGPLYHLRTAAFLLPSGDPAPLLAKDGPAAVGLALGGPALSAPVAAANERILELYGDNGRPFAKIDNRRVLVDVASKTMSATYTIEPGPSVRFGPAQIEGLNRVTRAYVIRRIAWQDGAPYDARLVERTRQDLVKSGLFSSVEIRHAAAPSPDGSIAMAVVLTEGPPHSIGAGAGYNTNIGLGAHTFWEDRNLFGNGEDWRLSAGAAQRQLGLASNFRRPDFLARQQDFLANAELLQETTNAYHSRRADAYVGLEELMFPPYTFGAGISLERANITQSVRNENYLLLGTPFYARRDTTDDILDPTEGTRTNLTVTPYRGLLGPRIDFVSSRLEERAYQRLTDSDQFVLAAYAALGTVEGVSLAQLPPDKRLYAGGAGSVRGYAYQKAGPLDAADVPIGGRSSLELGGEFRYRITDTIGVVPFFDAGNVFATNLPNRLSLFYSAGLGLRYYTAVGPIRLDIAVPIDRRPTDSAYQIYISIGQAF